MMESLSRSGLAHLLATHGVLSFEQLQAATESAGNQKKAFTRFLVDNNLISSKALGTFCSEQYGTPLLDFQRLDFDNIPDNLLNKKLIDKHHALPAYIDNKILYIAMSDPSNTTALEDFAFSFSLRTELILVEESHLNKAIQRLLGNGILSLDDVEKPDIEDYQLEAIQGVDDDAPIVKYINHILLDAVNKGVSDIHFEPYEKKYRIRFRIDGILHEVATPPVNLASRFSARLKVMSKLNIAERRQPQDGRIKLGLSAEQQIDLRVSTMPTMWGEKVVMRILDSSAANLDINTLGYTDSQRSKYLKALSKPHGMILITGPTGSGKTVSLYTGLNILNTVERNISTAEDPVEINLTGINQVQINSKVGLTFSSALRTFLRQDPDVVMVGEVRDLETAEIAIKAAQTGHLVLSTLHTNSAAETLTRLLNMGIPAFNIASSVTLIIAQRLVRRLCPYCKKELEYKAEELNLLGFNASQVKSSTHFYRAVGCEKCNAGYKGRIGIYEVMDVNDRIANIIINNGNALEIANAAELDGMDTLRKSALHLAAEGITSLQEVIRVT